MASKTQNCNSLLFEIQATVQSRIQLKAKALNAQRKKSPGGWVSQHCIRWGKVVPSKQHLAENSWASRHAQLFISTFLKLLHTHGLRHLGPSENCTPYLYDYSCYLAGCQSQQAIPCFRARSQLHQSRSYLTIFHVSCTNALIPDEHQPLSSLGWQVFTYRWSQ